MRNGGIWLIGNIELRLHEGKQRFRIARRGSTERSAVDFELSFFELLTILAATWMCIRKSVKGDFDKFADIDTVDIDLDASVESAKIFMAKYVDTKMVGVPLIPNPNRFYLGQVLRYTSFELRFLAPVEQMARARKEDPPSIPLDTRCLISSRNGGPLDICPDELFFLAIVAASDIFSAMETIIEEDERKASGRRLSVFAVIFGGILKLVGMPYWAGRALVKTIKYRNVLLSPDVKPNVKLSPEQHQIATLATKVAKQSSAALEPLFKRITAAAEEQERRAVALSEREAAIGAREEAAAREISRRRELLVAEFAEEKSRLTAERGALEDEKRRIGEETSALSAAQAKLLEERTAFETDLERVAEIPALKHEIDDLKVKNATLLRQLGQKALR